MGALRTLMKALVALALVGAGAILPASAPVNSGWTADPDEQFMLDVNLHRYRLGDGVRAYTTPEGTCLVLGDFLQALDVPMKIDLQAHRASGWAFKQDNTIDIDDAAHSVRIRGKSESFATTAVREVPEGWCIDSAVLARWFSLDLHADTATSMLLVDSTEKLPVEAAMERRSRAVGLKSNAAVDLSGLPRVRLPYRMWRAPAFEFIVNAGATYSAKTGVTIDRSASMYMAGEVAAMSYRASVQSDFIHAPSSVRATLYRSDPDGGLLGPLHATNVAVGDVEGLPSAFGGSTANGRGAVLTNQPLTRSARFDRTQFTGELPPGWDAELYRNGALIAFDDGKAGDGRYHFDDVEMTYGDNEFEVILYGPQGQEQHRHEAVNVGQDNVPKGQLWYWAGVREPGKDLISFHKSPAVISTDPSAPAVAGAKAGPELTASAQYGVSERLSVSALLRSTTIEDERVTYVEGAVRQSFGRALVEAAVAADAHGNLAARAQVAAKFGRVSVNASSTFANGFGAVSDRALKAEQRIAVSAPLRFGRTLVPVSADVSKVSRMDGTSALIASARLGAQIGRFNLSSETHYTRERGPPGSDDGGGSTTIETELIGAARVGSVRLRGISRWAVAPQSRFENAEIEASWSASERSEWQAGLAYDAVGSRVRGRVSHIHRFSAVDAGFTAEAASDGSVAAGISLSFSMAPFNGSGWRPTREKLATDGAIEARVFEDLNENGRLDHGEPLARKAVVTTGTRTAFSATDNNGEVVVGGLLPYQPIGVGIDQTTLDNPALTPAKAVQVVVPRPGVVAMLDIPLVGGGSIEGAVVREDQREVEGVDIELVDDGGKVVATARSDIDGYFLFERVRYGHYALRLTGDSAGALHLLTDLHQAFEVDRDHPLRRLGTIVVRAQPKIASAQ